MKVVFVAVLQLFSSVVVMLLASSVAILEDTPKERAFTGMDASNELSRLTFVDNVRDDVSFNPFVTVTTSVKSFEPFLLSCCSKVPLQF